MNKRLKIFFSVLLIFALFVSCFSIPVSSFETDVKTSTADMLLINVDTDTVVFSQKPDNMWYAGYLAELMTFLIASEQIKDPDQTTFQVEKSFIDSLPFSDGCLEKYIGQTLTAKDLEAIMLLTSGNDAAYALANLAAKGDIDAFVKDMNDRAAELGCTNTGYASPGYDETSDHYTTCRDLYKLYMEVTKSKFFHEVMTAKSYTPESLKDQEKDGEYTVTVEASILNPDSPYYFRYTNDVMYSYSEKTYAGIALTTTYHEKTYFYAGLLGLNESERNAYADAKKLATWAYLNLSDLKVLSAEDTLSGVTVKTGWGEYPVGLYPKYSAFKTLPNSFEASQLTYTLDIPETVKAPLFEGQGVGKAKIFYEGEEVDDLDVVISEDEGLGMLHDFGRFTDYAYLSLFPYSDMRKSYSPQNGEQVSATGDEKKETATEKEKSSEETAAPETQR